MAIVHPTSAPSVRLLPDPPLPRVPCPQCDRPMYFTDAFGEEQWVCLACSRVGLPATDVAGTDKAA